MRETYYITTPIYYASGNLHIGHSYTTLAADALARHKRLKGYDVFFLTGTDEHGLKIQRAAEAMAETPQQFVDKIVSKIQDLWRTLEISYDGFIRTTDEAHQRTVQWVFQKLYDNQDIYKKNYESWYCVGCEAFYTETQARAFENFICPDHGKPLERVQEESYFFRLSKYADRLLEYIDRNPDFIQPVSRRNEVIQFVKSGLEDLCISRTSFDWGIPVPFDPESVVYVWVDALTNYISAIGYPFDAERFEKYWPADVHLIGKEILRFHAVIWPILLMALDLPLPKKVFAHGWLNLGGKKMSKTMGNVVDPFELTRKYGLDAIRYFALREVPFGADGDYSEESLINRINADLANDLGNLVYRTLTMVRRFTNGKVPAVGREEDVDVEFKSECLALMTKVDSQMDNLNLSGALSSIMALVGKANKYIDDASPWELNKKGDSRLGTVLNYLCEGLRIVSLTLRPFMTKTPGLIWSSLGMPGSIDEVSWDSAGDWGLMSVGQTTRRGKPLFPRIEDEEELPQSKVNTENPKIEPVTPSKPEGVAIIGIDTFKQVDLRVAEVLVCEPVKGADRLLRLEISLGDETRQILAGVAQYYKPEELLHKQIIVVYNLKPAKIRGYESCGMLLAAKDGENLAVLTVDRKVKNGSRIS